MVNLKNKLIELDRNPAELSINFNRTSKYKSSVGGTLALLFFITAIGIISFRTLDLFQRNHRSIHLNVFKQNDLEALDISNINFVLTLVKSDGNPIPFEQYLLYGFLAIFEEYWIPIVGESIHKSTYLVPCNNQVSACLPANKSLHVLGNLEFYASQQQKANKTYFYQRSCITLARCDPNKTLGCKEFNNTRVKFYLNFNTPQVSSDENIIQQNMTRRLFQTHKPISNKGLTAITFYFKRVNFLTYGSILPQIIHGQQQPTETITDWFYDEEKFQEYYVDPDQNYLQVYFKRSTYTHEFTIKFDRFDKMVSQVNGMLAFVALILSCMYRGYNDWSFEQDVRKKLGIFYVKPTLWNFYKLKFRCRRETDEQIEQRLVLAAKLDYFKVAEQMSVIIKEEEFDFNTSFAQEAEGSSNFNPLLINRPTTLSPSSNRLSIN